MGLPDVLTISARAEITVSDVACGRLGPAQRRIMRPAVTSVVIVNPENASGAYPNAWVGTCYLVKQRSLHTCHGKKRFTVDSLREVGIHL